MTNDMNTNMPVDMHLTEAGLAMTTADWCAFEQWKRHQMVKTIRWDEWHFLRSGLDFPREIGWMEVRKLWGGAVMAQGMD